MAKNTLGFAGTGIMGSMMCLNLVKAGFEVTAYNRTRQKAEAIKGAKVADNPSDLCGNSDIVFTMVANDAALNEILFSKDGIISNLKKGQVLVDCSTTSIKLTEEIANECQKKGAIFIDAPVTGSKTGAENGTLMFMLGGESAAIEKCRPVLEAMGKKIVHCGKNTYGQRMKIALNLTQSMILESYLEGVVLGLKEGLPLEVITEVLNNSGARCNIADAKMPTITKQDYSVHFFLSLMDKDLKLASQEIGRLGISLPLADATIGLFDEALNKGYGTDDFSAIAKLLEEKVKVKINHSKTTITL